MRVLLVNPWVEDFAAYDFWARPLGLLQVAELIRRAGASVSFLDCLSRETAGGTVRFRATGKFASVTISTPAALDGLGRGYHRYGLADESFHARLDGLPPPDVVFVTCLMTYWYGGAFRAAALVRKRFPSAPVVLGGVYAALCPDHARRSGLFDAVFPQKTIPDLCAALGAYLGRPMAAEPPPVPAYDLYGLPLHHVAMVTGTGCPYRCSYCAAHRLYPRLERKAIPDLLRELETIVTVGQTRDIALYDDALLAGASSHALPFFEAVAGRCEGLRFHLPNAVHPGKLTDGLCAAMRKAGVATIRLGVESTARSFLRRSSGKVDEDAFAAGVDCLWRAGFRARDVGCYLLYGAPGLSVEDTLRDVALAARLGVKVSLAAFSPIPGTPDFEEAAKECPGIHAEPLLHNSTLSLVRRPEEYARVKEAVRRANERTGSPERGRGE